MSALAVWAERVPEIKALDGRILIESPDSEQRQKIRLVRKLIQEKNYVAASALLETLYEQEEESPVVINLLLTCYDRLGYLVKSETLARRVVERHPNNYAYRLRLAEVLTKQGRLNKAEVAYREAVSQVQNDDAAQYRTILNSMITYGLEGSALELIETVRKTLSDSAMFSLERGMILEKQNEYGLAALEFLAVLNDTGRAAGKAEKKLLSLLNYLESSAEVEQVLLPQADRAVNARAARILSSYYLRTEQFEQAFDFAVLQDSLEEDAGSVLRDFMLRCRERKLNNQVVRMAEYVLSHYRNHPIIGETYFFYADALVQLGRFDEAIAAYDTIIVTLPRDQDKAEALYRIGDIYLDKLNDPSRALEIFDSVVAYYQAGLGYLSAKLAIPYCHLRKGQLDRATTGFENMLQRRLNDDMKEEVEYNLALILFFEKKFDSSKVAFRKLLVDYRRGFYVNDAVQLLLVFDQAEGASDLLYEFSNALLFEQRRLPDSTAARLLSIAGNQNRALADIALYKLALLSLDRADSATAIEYIDRLAADFPESYYLPYGLKTKADVYLTRPDGLEAATSIYRDLLENYPNYPFISEVRKTLRQLEGEA